MPASRKVHALIAAVARGNTQAFEELYRLSCPKLYGLALRVLRQNDLAASAMRRAFIQIRAEAHRHSPQEDSVGFLVARLRAATFDIARTGAGIDAWEPFEVENPARDPLALDGRSLALTRLLTCLGALPEERRRMVLLAYYDGWSREALAIVFDAPVAAVRALIAKSTDQVAECLGKKPPASFSDVDRHMAAEYALGTLDAEERTAVRAQMEQAPDFGRLVRQWERRLAPLHELAAPVAPPPGLWTAIAGDLRRQPVAAIAPRVPVAAAPAGGVSGAGAPAAGAPAAGTLASLPPDGPVPSAGRGKAAAARPAGARKQGLFSFMLERVTGRPSSGATRGTRDSRPAPVPLPVPVVAIPPAPPAAAKAEVAAAEEALPLRSPVPPPPPPRRSASVQRHPVRSAVAPKAPSGPPLDAEARAAAFRALAEAIDLRIGAADDAAADLTGPPAPEVPPAVGATASPASGPAPAAQPDDAARAAAFRMLAEAIDLRIGAADGPAAESSGEAEPGSAPAPEVRSSVVAAAPAEPDDAVRAAAFRALAEAIDLRIGSADGTPPEPAVPSAPEPAAAQREGAGDGAVDSAETAAEPVVAPEAAGATLLAETAASVAGDGPAARGGTATGAETGGEGAPDGGGVPPEPLDAADLPDAIAAGVVAAAGDASATGAAPGPTAASLPAPCDLPQGASAAVSTVAGSEVAGANAPASVDATGVAVEAGVAPASEAGGASPSSAEDAFPAVEAPQPEDAPQVASAALSVAEEGQPDGARRASEGAAPLHAAPAADPAPAPDGPAVGLHDAYASHAAEMDQPRQAEVGSVTVQAAGGTEPVAAAPADPAPDAPEQDGPPPAPYSGRNAAAGAADADLQPEAPAGTLASADHGPPKPAKAGEAAPPSQVRVTSPADGLVEPGVSSSEPVWADTPLKAAPAQPDAKGAARAESGAALAGGADDVPANAGAVALATADAGAPPTLLPTGVAEAAPAAMDDEGSPASAGPGDAGGATLSEPAMAEVSAHAASAAPPATDAGAPAMLPLLGAAEAATATNDDAARLSVAQGDAGGATFAAPAAAVAEPLRGDLGALASPAPSPADATGSIAAPGGEMVQAAADKAEQAAAAPSDGLSADVPPAAGDVAQAARKGEAPERPAALPDGRPLEPVGAPAIEPGAAATPAALEPAASSPADAAPPSADAASPSGPQASPGPPDPAEAVPQPIVLPPPVFRSAGSGAPAAASSPAPEPEMPPPEILAASLARWRRAGVVLSALVVALGAYGLHRTLWPVTGDRYVSVLQQEPSPALSIRLDPQDGVVRVQVLAPELPAGGRYALWLVTEKSGTHLIFRFSGSTVAHSAALKRIGKAGLANATLTVTVEPSEAAAVPLAPGANVVYRGRLAPE